MIQTGGWLGCVLAIGSVIRGDTSISISSSTTSEVSSNSMSRVGSSMSMGSITSMGMYGYKRMDIRINKEKY